MAQVSSQSFLQVFCHAFFLFSLLFFLYLTDIMWQRRDSVIDLSTDWRLSQQFVSSVHSFQGIVKTWARKRGGSARQFSEKFERSKTKRALRFIVSKISLQSYGVETKKALYYIHAWTFHIMKGI